jgi:hypothetical protein
MDDWIDAYPVDAKRWPRGLNARSTRRQVAISHSQALEIVAAQLGCEDWNVLAAKIGESRKTESVAFEQTAPILRICAERAIRETC